MSYVAFRAPAERAAEPAVPLRAALDLARDDAGLSRIGLTLLLDRRPGIDEDIAPLVVRGVFAMTVRLTVPGAGLLHTADLRLVDAASETCLAADVLTGSREMATLGATLGADHALAVLSALDGTPCALTVDYQVRVRTEPLRRTVRLGGRWSDVWDVLAAASGVEPPGPLTADQVLAAYRRIITDGVVTVTVSGAEAADAADAAAELLRSAGGFLLQRGPEGWLLRARPVPHMPVSVAEELLVPAQRTIIGSTGVTRLLAGAGAEERDRIVRLVALDPATVATPIPVVAVEPVVTVRPRRAPPSVVDLVRVDGRLTAVPLVLNKGSVVAAQASAGAFKNLVAQPNWKTAVVVAPKLLLDPAGVRQPGPVVDQPEAPFFSDRVDPGLRWYVPEYRLRRPAPDADPASAPFRFTFSRLGLTGGPAPSAGLDATIVLTLDPFPPDAVFLHLLSSNSPPPRPVTPVGLTASLEVPYRVEGGAEVRFHTVTGQVTPLDGGALRLTVRAYDHIARLCYGALAYEGFQTQPVAVVVQFSFDGWVRTGTRGMRPVGSVAVFRGPAARNRFEFPKKELVPKELIKTKPGTPWWELEKKPHLVPIDPFLKPGEVIPPAAWSATVVGRAARVPALVRCADHPALYQQNDGTTTQVVGCQDALRLGESAPPRYAELPEFGAAGHRVLRSLQQPDRFLVLPAAFRITRRGPESGPRAYHPSILIHAALGGGQDRYVFTAALVPAIPLHTWRSLLRRLRSLCPPGVAPQLQLPTDPTVHADVSYKWALPAEIAEPVVTRTWEGFQVAVSTQLASGLILNSLIETGGLSGEARFQLPDGLSLTSTLVLDTEVVGPWLDTPVTVTPGPGGTQVTLTNHTERTADVFDLMTAAGTTVSTADATLAPGGTARIPVDDAAAELIAVYALHPDPLSIEQLNAYVADVSTRIGVVNLVNYANHRLARLELEIRGGLAPAGRREVPEGGQLELPLTFSLTSYLAARSVDFRVHLSFTDGRTVATAWSAWDLSTAGTVLSLTSQLLALGRPS